MSARMGDFGVVDYTPLMALAPRTENFLEKLGVFDMADADYIDQRYAEFEREEKGLTDMYNVARGGERQFMGSEGARKELIEVPYATLDTNVRGNEVEAFREYGTESSTATIEALVERKIQHIQRSHGKYIRDVQYTALLENKIRAVDSAGNEVPALAKNFSTLWGAPRKTATVDTTAATDPFVALGAARQEIVDDMGENTGFSGMVLMVTTRDFNAIVGHAQVRSAFENRDAGTTEYLTRRLGGDALHQVFTFKGITVLEDTSGKLTNGTGVMFPLDYEGMFKHTFAPAYGKDFVNKVSTGSALFLLEGWREDRIESELSYCCMITRSELIANVTITV